MNALRTTFLMALLTVLLVLAGGAIGGRSGMTFALVMAGVMNFVSYWFSDKIVLAMYGAQEATEAEYPEFFGLVRQLAIQAAIPMPRVYIISSETPNAFATGRNPEHAAVAATSGILRILTRDELTGGHGARTLPCKAPRHPDLFHCRHHRRCGHLHGPHGPVGGFFRRRSRQ